MSDVNFEVKFGLSQADAALGNTDDRLNKLKQSFGLVKKEAKETNDEAAKAFKEAAKQAEFSTSEITRYASAIKKIETGPLEAIQRQARLADAAFSKGKIEIHEYIATLEKLNQMRVDVKQANPSLDPMLGKLQKSQIDPMAAQMGYKPVDPYMARMAAGARETERTSAEAMSMGNRMAAANKERIATEEKLQAELKQTADAEKALIASRQASDKKAVAAITAENTAPLDQYKQKIAELNRLKTEAGLAEDIHARAVSAAKKELQDAIGLTARRKEAEREREKATKDAAAADKKAKEELEQYVSAAKRLIATPVQRAMMDMAEETKKADAAMKAGKLTAQEHSAVLAKLQSNVNEVAQAERNAAASADQNFGDQALNKLIQYTAGMFALTSIVQKAGEALQFAAQQRIQGGESIKSDFEVYQGINELSDTQEQYDQRIKDYESLKSNFGLSREQASTLQETAISTGNEETMWRFAATQGAGDPAERMKAAARLETLSKGKINELQADAAVTAAAIPSQFRASEIAKYVPTAAAPMAMQGTGTIELLGAHSTLSDVLKAPEMAADRLSTLQTKMSLNDQTKGKGLLGGVDAITAMSQEDRKTFLGSDELNIAYNKIVENRAEIEKRMEFIKERSGAVGTEADPVLAAQKRFEGNEKSKVALENRVVKQDEEAANRDAFGAQRVSGETRASQLQAEDVRLGRNPVSRFIRSTGRNAALLFGGSADTVESASNLATTAMSPLGLLEQRSANGGTAMRKTLGMDGDRDPQMDEQTEVLRSIHTAIEKNTGKPSPLQNSPEAK